MRLKNSKEIAAFEKAIAASKGEVWLETPRRRQIESEISLL